MNCFGILTKAGNKSIPWEKKGDAKDESLSSFVGSEPGGVGQKNEHRSGGSSWKAYCGLKEKAGKSLPTHGAGH